MGRGRENGRRRSSALTIKAVVAGLLFVAGLVLGGAGRATITAPPSCETPDATAPAAAGAIRHG
ncbi:hypothetical protein [Tsukamurella sp. USMM236]|uniref:hypothetical protein n=1 Tax=Tsukamurella sp. USMM236 TaxID=3081301 RepID=UPI003018AFEE